MTKRIISIILAAVMLLSFPAVAGAQTRADFLSLLIPPMLTEQETEAESSDSGNMRFAKAMGIIAEDALGTDQVTRLDLAKMFCAVMRTDVGMATSQGMQFTDVPAEATSVVAHVADMGIMNGVGGGLFAPDAPVTYIQALKAMVTFLGYADYAEAKNGYPYGYLVQAMELDLISNAPEDVDTPITVEKAVSLFKRAINVDYREPVEFNPEVKYEISENLTYLHYHRDIVRVRGIVRSTSLSDISGLGTTAYDKVRIGSNLLGYDSAIINVNELFGYTVDAYVELESENIIYIENAGTDVVKLSSTEISGLVGDNIEYYNDSGKKKKLAINDSTRVIYNGTEIGSYNENDINPFAGSPLDGGITVIDNTGDGVYDIVFVDAYTTYIVNKVSGNKIYAENTTGAVLDLDNASDYVEGKGCLIYNVLGQPVSIGSITEGAIISVSADDNGKTTRIVVTIDSTIGILNATETLNGRLYITVNGQKFECSNAVMADPETSALVIGKKVKISFDKNILVSDIDQEMYNEWLTGYLAAYGVTNGIDPELQVKVFGEDSKWYIMNLADEININENATAVAAAPSFINAATTVAGGLVKRQPILYKVNGNGELKEVIFPETPIDVTDANYTPIRDTSPFYVMKAMQNSSTWVIADGTNNVEYTNNDAGFRGSAVMTSGTLFFSVPDEANRASDKDYSVLAPDALGGNGLTIKVGLYSRDEWANVDVAVVENYSSPIINDTHSVVVKKIDRIIDENGDAVYRLAGISNSKEVVYTDVDGILDACPAGLPEPGDVLRFSVDNTNVIKKAEFAFDASKKEVWTYNKVADTYTNNLTVGYSSATYIESPRFTYGTVVYAESSFVVVEVQVDNLGTVQNDTFALNSIPVAKVTKNARGDISVEVGDAADLIDRENYSAEASKVLVHTRAGRGTGLVIYEGF